MSVQGREVMVTGATGGIGRASALTLAAAGARLTLVARSEERGKALLEEIAAMGGEEASLMIADLADLGSVREAALEWLSQGRQLDVLLNNAGVVCTRYGEIQALIVLTQ